MPHDGISRSRAISPSRTDGRAVPGGEGRPGTPMPGGPALHLLGRQRRLTSGSTTGRSWHYKPFRHCVRQLGWSRHKLQNSYSSQTNPGEFNALGRHGRCIGLAWPMGRGLYRRVRRRRVGTERLATEHPAATRLSPRRNGLRAAAAATLSSATPAVAWPPYLIRGGVSLAPWPRRPAKEVVAFLAIDMVTLAGTARSAARERRDE